MKITFSFLTLVVLLAAAQSQHVRAQRSLVQFLSSVDMSSSSAQQVAACFSEFLPLLTAITTNFSTQYEACISLAAQSTNSLITSAAAGKSAYMNETAELCKVFNYCANETDFVASFNCYGAVAQDDIKTLYELSNNVALSATKLTTGLNSIQSARKTCTTSAEDTYVRNTARMYDELDNCLQQGPATTTSITTTTVVTATAAAPVAGTGGVASVALNVVQTDCSNGDSRRTQISPDGKQTQTQTQTGPGCQSQVSNGGSSSNSNGQGTQQQSQCNGDKCVSSSNNGGSSSSTNTGSQSQSQCSGASCGQWQPLKPLFTMAPMAPMPTMAPLLWNMH